MRLLNEIIDTLSSNDQSLENALFKAQVLAHKLGEEEMKQWVGSEIKGYHKDVALPDYRKLPVTIFGNVANVAWMHKSIALATKGIEAEVRKQIEIYYARDSISVVEKWGKEGNDMSLIIPPEYYHYLSKALSPGFVIQNAWGKCSPGAFTQIKSEVKSRLLELVLQVSDKIPQEPDPESIKQVSKEIAVSELFRNTVFGDNTTILIGDGNSQKVINKIHQNDMGSLVQGLREQGISEQDLQEMEMAIDQDRGSEAVMRKEMGPKVKKWIAGMVAKAADGAWNVSIAVAGGLLSQSISAYYGFN
ncbi:hypothetical protein [Chromobacterium sp. CV08]|uniref:AbiTii domain-containing protein n=1 Tax=Chromobacterium sp. CV08 TaxID=3133274 RepID=UPI003DA7F794